MCYFSWIAIFGLIFEIFALLWKNIFCETGRLGKNKEVKKKTYICLFFVQVEFEFNFLPGERPFWFKFSSVDCFLKKLDGMGGWYTSLQTCLWSVCVRFSELNVAQRLHLRPGWKDYSVSIFINPWPFPLPCSPAAMGGFYLEAIQPHCLALYFHI